MNEKKNGGGQTGATNVSLCLFLFEFITDIQGS